MAASRVTEKLQGILVPDGRFTDSTNLQANTAAALTSDYSQSTPRPGTALAEVSGSQLRPAIEGGQAADVNVRVMAAGNPGRDGVQLGYKLDSEAATEWRGWQTPNEITTSSQIENESGTAMDAAVIPSTQEVIAIYAGTVASARTALWSPTAWTWTANGAIDATTITTDHAAVVVLPGTERIIALRNAEVLYSDDKGVSWSTFSARPFRSISNPSGPSRMVVCANGSLMLVCQPSGSDVRHYASSDDGATWTQVGSYSTFGLSPSLAALPDGRVVIAYRDTASGDPQCRVLPGPYSTATDYSEVSIAATPANNLAVTAEPDGTLYALYWISADDVVALARSTDAGANWTVFDSHVFNDESNNSIDGFCSVPTMGGIMWIAESLAVGIRGSVLGGWTNLTSTSTDDINDRYGWAAGSNRTWLPFGALPGALTPWTETNSGTSTSADGKVAWDITTTTGTRYAARTGGLGTGLELRHRIDLLLNSGGSLSTCAAGVRGRVSDNSTKDFRWALRCTTTTVRLYDEHAAANVSSDVSVDMTGRVQWHVVTWHDSSNVQQVRTYYRATGDETWTLGHTGTLQNTGGTPASAGDLAWGAPESGTSDIEIYQWMSNLDSADGQIWVTGRDNVLGRPLGNVGIPAPNIGSTTQVGKLSARGGVGQAADGYTIAAVYDYPLYNALPGVDPSPSVVWRSNGLAEQVVAFDLDAASLVGRALGVFLGNCNFRTAYIEYSTGGSWTTLGTIDMATGFTSLSFTRDGDIIRPDTASTSDAGRMVAGMEAVGGFVLIDPAGTTYARKVEHNRGGAWCGSSSVSYPEFRVKGITGSEPSSGTCHIVWPTGLHVLTPTNAVRARYWRLRIPAQDCPNVDYQIGTFAVGPIRVMGQQTAWGWSKRGEGNAASSFDYYGTDRRRKRGPIRRSWVWSWDETERYNALRTGADLQNADYISAGASTEPLVTDRVVWSQLRAILAEAESGAMPVVVCDALPADDTTLTSPERFLYGHITGGYSTQHVVGIDDATDQLVRPGRITVDEVV